jgi:hypothetical protein
MGQLLSVLVIGAGIGWLAGLSISPVIGTVLASLLGVAGGIVAGVHSVARTQGDGGTVAPMSIDARPAALLVLGISLGAPFGIIARTHALFEKVTPVQSSKMAQTAKLPQSDLRSLGGLFGSLVETCDELRTLASYPNERAFRDALASKGKWGQLIERNISDTGTLKTIVEDLCVP